MLLATMVAAAFVIVHTREVRFTGRAGVARELPDRVGAWTGEAILFCQTATCQWAYTSTDLGGSANCTRCGGELSPGSFVEWSILPRDTAIIRKIYTRAPKEQIVATIVLSGADRTSIHRPQICLVGGGQEIVRTVVRTVPLASGETLEVVVLDLLWRGAEAGRPAQRSRFFAYWFVGPDRVTPSHFARMFWMGFDRIFRGITHRWAYISLNGAPGARPDDHLKWIDDFTRDFYPLVMTPSSDPAPSH